ncbi:MAG: 23S rRNA (guanosine(2251)-2'-O)-methyltransferase RlmB [Bacteroidales bacterium]|nr:23S rRNA (guanosine(2251)-2'-O)-methyltransferase RlmB [Bacteroidales bacterium]
MKNNDLIYGIHPVMEAVLAGRELEKVMIQKGLTGDNARVLKALLAEKGITYQPVPPEKLNRLVRGVHQGVVAFVSQVTYQNIEDILPFVYEQGEVPFILVLDRVTDVRNFGAVARSAECAGVHAIIIPARESALITGDAIKTSAGALSRLLICKVPNLKDTLNYLQDSGLTLFAVTEKAQESFYSVDFRVPAALILGSEEDGVSPELIRMARHLVHIPMKGEIGSLNVSVAAALTMYELVRQRNEVEG